MFFPRLSIPQSSWNMSFKLNQVRLPESQLAWSQDWRISSLQEQLEACQCDTIRDVLSKLLPGDGRILEAGCGMGRWVIWLKERGYDIYGLDISQEALASGKQFDRDLRLAMGDVTVLPVNSHSVDAVLCLGVVEHFEHGPQDALAEMHRVLRVGGLLFLSVPFNSLFRRLVANPLIRLRHYSNRKMVNFAFGEFRFSKREVHRHLVASGFEPLSFHPDDFDPPRSKGLFVDYQALRTEYKDALRPPERPWVLDGRWAQLARVLNRLSPWLGCGMILCVAKAV